MQRSLAHSLAASGDAFLLNTMHELWRCLASVERRWCQHARARRRRVRQSPVRIAKRLPRQAEARNAMHRTPFHVAVSWGKISVVRCMMVRSQRPMAPSVPIAVAVAVALPRPAPISNLSLPLPSG